MQRYEPQPAAYLCPRLLLDCGTVLSAHAAKYRNGGLRLQITTLKKILDDQIIAAMRKNGLTKSAMAARMQTIRRALRLLDPKNTGVTLPCNGPHENHQQSKSIFPIPSTTYRHTTFDSRQTRATLEIAGRQFPTRKSAALIYFEGEKSIMSNVAQIEANSATSYGNPCSVYASQAVLLTADDRAEFEDLASTYEYELRPSMPVERTLFGQLVLAAWNMQRTNRLEAALATDGTDPLLSESHEKTLARITTARMRAERTFHKTLKELRATQAARPEPKPFTKNEANSGSNVRSMPRTEPSPASPLSPKPQDNRRNEPNPPPLDPINSLLHNNLAP